MHGRPSRHQRSSSSEGSSPHSTPQCHCHRSNTRSPQQSPSLDPDSVDLNCSHESAFPEDAVTYGSSDLRFRDPEFYQQMLGASSRGKPPPTKRLQTSAGKSTLPTTRQSSAGPSRAPASTSAAAPMDLSASGRKPSSKAPKSCPYCPGGVGENLRRHAYGVHVPWYMDPTRVCWSCEQSFKQHPLLQEHLHQSCPQGSFEDNAAKWAPRITKFFEAITQELSLPTMEDLVPHVQTHRKFLPRAGASMEVLDQEVMKLYELQWGTYPEDRHTYKQDPPNCLAALLQWQIIGGLMTLMSDPIRVELMDVAASAPVTRQVAPQEDPSPLPPPSHPLPLPPTHPLPSAAATPLTEVQQIFRAATKAPREQAPPSSAPPLMLLKVPTPSHLASSSAGASTRLSTAAPPTTTCLVVSTSGSTRQVTNPQEDIPPLDTISVPDIPPLNTIPVQDLPH